jgi:hypothetical protein
LRVGKIDSIDNSDDGSLNRHVLIADRRARGLAVGAHDNFASPAPRRSATTTTFFVGLTIQIVWMNDQKAHAFQIGVFFVDQTVPMTLPKNMIEFIRFESDR